MKIHPTAIISNSAQIGEDVEIGPYALIEDGVVVGDNTKIEAYAKLCKGSCIGKGCRICSFSTIAGDPQDLHFDTTTVSFAEIGDGTIIRENSTIHRATFEGKSTIIGKNCFLMSGSHVGHDCVLGDNVIFANYATAAGHVHIDSHAFISGGAMLHQKIRIGEGVMFSGNGASSKDAPPFINAFGRNSMAGLNIIGMSRRKFSREEIAEVKELYGKVYASVAARRNALALLAEGAAKTPAGLKFLKFFEPEGRHYLVPRQCEE